MQGKPGTADLRVGSWVLKKNTLVCFGMKCGMGVPPMIAFSHEQYACATVLRSRNQRNTANSLLAEAQRARGRGGTAILSRRHGEKNPSQNNQQPIARGGTAKNQIPVFVYPPCLRERMAVENFFLP